MTFVQHFWGRSGRLPLALVIGLAFLVTACGSASAEPPAADVDSRLAPLALGSPVPGNSSGESAVPAGKGSSRNDAGAAPSELEGSQGKGQPTLVAPEPAQTERLVDLGPAPGIEPDPDYKEALENSGFSTGGWDTDFSLH